MTTLTKRVLTAAVLLALLGTVLFALPQPSPAATWLFSAFLLMGLWEWSGFMPTIPVFARLLYLACGVAIAVLLLLSYEYSAASVLAGAVVWWLVMLAWLIFGPLRFGPALTAIAGLCCLLPAWFALILLLNQPDGAWRLIWLVGMVAAADTSAYFCGRAFGRHKLAPAISPGKTIEGFAGGLLAASAAGAAGGYLAGYDPAVFLVVGAVIAGISVVGDLSVSAFKRSAGVKDSGWILPGHGGVMDRIDSLVAALPLFMLLLAFFDRAI